VERHLLRARVLVIALVLAHTSNAAALDTVEPFEAHAANAEHNLTYHGVGQANQERELSNEFVLGYGMSDRASAYLGACLSANQQDTGAAGLCFGLIGTVWESDHIDLDLLMDIGASGHGLGDLSTEPGLELNFDHDPDMHTWGVYMRMGILDQASADGSLRRRRLDLGVNPGAYFTLSARYQLLVEFDASVALGGDRTADENVGGVALGLNAVVSDSVELIAQVHADVPQSDRGLGLGLSLGFIATFPAGR